MYYRLYQLIQSQLALNGIASGTIDGIKVFFEPCGDSWKISFLISNPCSLICSNIHSSLIHLGNLVSYCPKTEKVHLNFKVKPLDSFVDFRKSMKFLMKVYGEYSQVLKSS